MGRSRIFALALLALLRFGSSNIFAGLVRDNAMMVDGVTPTYDLYRPTRRKMVHIRQYSYFTAIWVMRTLTTGENGKAAAQGIDGHV